MSLLVAAIVAGASCATDAPSSDVTVRDSAGARLVHNHSAADSVTAHLVEVARIGVENGAEAYQFDGIRSILRDDADTLYVLNGRTASIRVFDPKGTFVRQFGRRGQGPGEFSSPGWAFLAGPELVAVQSPDYVSIFRRSGEFIDRWQTMTEDAPVLRPLALVSGGWLVSRAEPPDYEKIATGSPWRMTGTLHVGDLKTGVLGPPLRTTLGPRLIPSRGGEGGVDWPLFDPQPGFAVGIDGTQYAAGETYQIDVFGADGKLRRRITRTHSPKPITDADISALKDRIRQRYRDRPSRPGWEGVETVLTRIDGMNAGRVATHWAPLGALIASDEGAIWVARTDLGENLWMSGYNRLYGEPFDRNAPGGLPWDRFDRDGRYLGAIIPPSTFRPFVIGDDWVIGVLRDELDIEYVARYRIERGPPRQ